MQVQVLPICIESVFMLDALLDCNGGLSRIATVSSCFQMLVPKSFVWLVAVFQLTNMYSLKPDLLKQPAVNPYHSIVVETH